MTAKNLTGWRYVAINVGDTLQSIAARELNDASAWPLLIAINKLAFPYITGNPAAASDSVKLYGQFIVVPGVAPQPNLVVDPYSVFGVDLDLTGGYLHADASGDFAVVSGRANLTQAIQNLIATAKRELVRHLNYGTLLRRIVGAGNGPTSMLLAGEYVKGALLDDTRIASVSSTVVTSTGDQIQVEATAIPINGAPLTVSVGV